VAGTAAAWQAVDVSLSAGEVVPDRKLFLPPQPESYSHDLDGNMTGDGRWTYTWDGENRLMSASTTSGAYTAGVPGRKVEYAYDWMGRMIRRVGYSGNPITLSWTLTDDTRFAYDGWLCRWESMTNSSAASKPWVTSIRPSMTVRSDYSGWVGMRILTGDSPVWVTRLGRWVLSGNGGSHTVKLVTASTGVDVSGGSVSVNTSGASTNRFLYADLASPIQLAANSAYYLVSLETNGGDKWYQNDTVVSPGPGLTVTHAVHGSGGSYWTSGTANNGYGPVSLVGVPAIESRTQIWGLDLSGSEQGAGGVGGLLGTRTGTAASRFMAYDGNGNIVGIVNGGNGKTAATMQYSPFGETIARDGDGEQDRYGFSTKCGDGDTGICYYGYRFYSPETGRWLSRDPIEENGGVAISAILANSIVNAYDALGLEFPHSGNTQGRRYPNYWVSPLLPRFEGPFSGNPFVGPRLGPNDRLPDDFSGFAICQRAINAEDCMDEVANRCGYGHKFILYKSANGVKQGIGFYANNRINVEKNLTCDRAATCSRTSNRLKYGRSIGKTGVDASNEEIWDCLKDRPPIAPYTTPENDCRHWPPRAAADCGLACAVQSRAVSP
jgi:RHS repeat-associated protein